MKISKIRDAHPIRDHGTTEFSDLKESIKRHGLIEPLVINQDGRLLCGRRRVQALNELGINEAPVRVIKTKNEIEEFDISFEENVRRKNFTDLEIEEALVERKKLYLQQYPETKRGGDRGNQYTGGKPTNGRSDSFAEETAKRLGVSKRKIERYLQAHQLRKDHPQLKNEPKSLKVIQRARKIESRKGTVIPKEIDMQLRCGDFRQLIGGIANETIDAIITDPPYGKEFLPLWNDLARESARVLKNGGFFISYVGQLYLVEVLESLKKHLEYRWLAMLHHQKGPSNSLHPIFHINVLNRAKPILIFCKPPARKSYECFEDVIISDGPMKECHEWGQSVEPFKKLLSYFFLPFT